MLLFAILFILGILAVVAFFMPEIQRERRTKYVTRYMKRRKSIWE